MKLNLQHLTKRYGDTAVLDDINLSIDHAQVVALIGASGSGKSTLLRLIAGLESFDEGRILVNDQEIDEETASRYRKTVGFVFQDHNLFSHLSVMENILLVLEKVHKKPRKLVLPQVERLLESFDLMPHAHKLPHQISGGQSQRVSIVRALAIEPSIILLDEPTSSLDPILTYEVLVAIRKLVEEKRDIVLVTHEIGFAKHTADHIIFMDEGKIVEQGGPDMLQRPQTQKLKDFLDKVLTFHED